jgi:hypothetical protein
MASPLVCLLKGPQGQGGVRLAGNTFIRAMLIVLYNIRLYTEPFVDDMAVCSISWTEHLPQLTTHLRTIQESGLTLNLKKCSFGQSKVTFVGHLIGSGTKAIDPSKVACFVYNLCAYYKEGSKKTHGFFQLFSFIHSRFG